jgi:serine/threonine-protein kinase
VIDFGIALSHGREVEATRRGTVKGKAGYMSPEQLLGHPIDRRSDVFSLGIVAYEATAQARAFRAGSDHETARRVVHGEVRPPAAARPGYPADLAQVVMNALSVDPAARYQTAAELGSAVEKCAGRLGLPLGDAVIAAEMQILYPDVREPWVRARTPRGSGRHETIDRVDAVDVLEVEAPDADEATTARFVMIDGDALDPSLVWEPEVE